MIYVLVSACSGILAGCCTFEMAQREIYTRHTRLNLLPSSITIRKFCKGVLEAGMTVTRGRATKQGPRKASSLAEHGLSQPRKVAKLDHDDQDNLDEPGPSFYLMKSEPDSFSIDDLEGRKDQTEPWDGESGRNDIC